MKTIGVLGGIGPQATLDFEARVHSVSQRLIPQRGNMGYPTLVVYYLRQPPAVVAPDLRPVLPPQPDPAFLDAAKKLGPLCDFLVIISNAAHMFQDQVEQASGRKVLSMIDVTLDEIKDQGKKIGVLGMGDPVVYTAALDRLGIQCETLSGEMRNRLDEAIIALDEGRDGPETVRTAMEAVAELRGREVDWIILGCTEIPLLLGKETNAPDLINPAQLLAEAAVRHATE